MKSKLGASGRALVRRTSSALVLLAALLVTAPLSPASAQSNVVFVDASPSGTGNTGTSWANAYSDLSVALSNSASGSQLWVAAGTYKPSSTDQTASFEIPAGVEVFGGFEGTETLLSQRDLDQFGTILSGEINSGVDFDNSENIVVFDNADGARLDGVIVTGGFADGATDGGGIRVVDSADVIIANTRVANSEATTNGGAIAIEDSSVAVISSRLDTSGAQLGGALYSTTSNVVITNTLVFLNSGLNALRFENGTDAFVTNVTVADNTTTGGAVSTAFGSSAILTNSIVRDNGGASFSGAATTATFSNIEGGAFGTGNIDVDPLFDVDYSLGFSSPSIDAGSDAAVPPDAVDVDDDGDTLELTPDLFRQTRVLDDNVDQGAIESLFCPAFLHVDASNTALNQDGLDWATAFSDLQDALAIATLCGDDQLVNVRVAAGTYTPTTSTADRAASFDIAPRTNLFGGYAPGGSSEPDSDAFLTLLTGDILGNDGTITDINHPNRSENSYRVVVIDHATGAGNDIEGVRIEGGNANGPTPEQRAGAGLFVATNSGFDLRDVEIRRNAAEDAGGGLALNTTSPSDARIVNSEIVLNESSSGNGGGVALLNGSLLMTNSTVRLNTAASGGGIFATEGSIELRNVRVTENEAEIGGGFFLDDGTVTEVTLSTIAENVGRERGGAFAGEGTPFSLTMSNSIVFGNQSDGELSFSNVDNRTITFSTIEGGEPGVGNLSSDPQFVAPATNNFSLSNGSASIDAGLASLLPTDTTDVDDDSNFAELHPSDLNGDDRLIGFAVDHGAFESSTGGSCGVGTIVYVDQANDSLQDGESWLTAFTDLQIGLLKANSCPQVDEIRIAEGTYLPTSAGNRFASFEIRGGLTVTGGYPETGGITSDPTQYETILSGDLDGDDNGALGINNTSRFDNSYLVVDLLVDEATPTTLVNLTIADGHDNQITSQSTASGIRLSTGQLVHVRIERNVARSESSGIEARNPIGVQIIDTVVTGNGDEPAVGIQTGNFNGAPGPTQYDIEFVNSAIVDNESGSIAIDANNGGGLRPVDVTLVNSLVADNGAALAIDGGADIDVMAVNSTIADNTAFFSGEVVGNATNGSLVLENSILWNDGDGFVQSAAPGVSAAANASTVSGGTIAGSLDIDPEFVDPANGDYRLLGSSDLINLGSNPLIAVDTADLDNDGNTTEDVPFDLEGNPRVRNGTVDIGAYETVADDLTVLKAPCVVYDSTSANGALGGTFDGGDLRTVQVAGALNGQGGESPCIPDDATLALVTITAIDPQGGGNLRLSAAGVAPTGGVVNYADNGLFNSNTVAVPLSDGGAVDIFANGGAFGTGLPSTDVRLTVLAYANEDGKDQFVPITPCAAHDSRANQGADSGWAGPFGAGSGPDPIGVIDQFDPQQGGGNSTCGIPQEATGIVANVVAINPGGDTGFLSISPVGEEHGEPLTNFTVLTPAMNNAATVVVPLEGSGQLQIIVEGDSNAFTETRLVILGYTTEKEASRLVPVDACAAFDTRSNQGATSTFAGLREGAQATTYQVSGAIPSAQGGGNGGTCGVPESATAVLLNLVAINSVGPGNLQAYATGTTPTGGVLNFNGLTPAMNNSNAVIVPLSASGELTVNVNGGPFGVGVPLSEIRGVVLGYFD